jgi:hypothetical protein
MRSATPLKKAGKNQSSTVARARSENKERIAKKNRRLRRQRKLRR